MRSSDALEGHVKLVRDREIRQLPLQHARRRFATHAARLGRGACNSSVRTFCQGTSYPIASFALSSAPPPSPSRV